MDKPFTSDHCSVVPEYDVASCCVQHDWLYWQGGSGRDRRAADRAFYLCLRNRAGWFRARIRWLGVRLGGLGFLPLPWRWGYGWRWPRSSPPDPSPYTVENQREEYERILREAEAADRRARDGG